MWTPGYAQLAKDKPVFKWKDWDYFTGDAVISCKTGDGMRLKTGTQRGTKGEYSLPYWGNCTVLEQELSK